VDKVSELLGLDAPTVYEIYKEKAEDELQRKQKTLSNKPRNRRNSHKALSMLGHDLSKEKVKRTLGIDEEAVHQVEEDIIKQQELRLEAHRRAEGSPHKKQCLKALTTLGLDPSIHKATKLLGVDEDTLRDIYREELQIQEEKILRQRRRDTLRLHDRRRNRKAHHVVGYDPSLEKVLDTLGVAPGTQEGKQVGARVGRAGEGRAHEPPHAASYWPTALVYTLSAIILFSSFSRSL